MKFYSEKLNKPFDTVKELEAAEKALLEQETKKALAVKQRKEEAAVVEEAFKARNAARRTYNNNVVTLMNEYNKSLTKLKDTVTEAKKVEAEKLEKAEKAYDEVLNEFIKKHDSYHMTLRDGDNVVTISNTTSAPETKELFDVKSFFDMFRELWGQ